MKTMEKTRRRGNQRVDASKARLARKARLGTRFATHSAHDRARCVNASAHWGDGDDIVVVGWDGDGDGDGRACH
jgi:hypothetical protein